MNQKMLSIAIFTLAAFAATAVTAQHDQPSQRYQFEIETDLGILSQGGYEITFGNNWRHLGIHLSHNRADVPEFIHNQDNFLQTSTSLEIMIDYFLRADNQGWFAGPVFLHTEDEIAYEPTGNSLHQDYLYFGARVGYRWLPFRNQRQLNKGLMLTVFFQPMFNTADDLRISGQTFEYRNFSPFGSLHLGWKF